MIKWINAAAVIIKTYVGKSSLFLEHRHPCLPAGRCAQEKGLRKGGGYDAVWSV